MEKFKVIGKQTVLFKKCDAVTRSHKILTAIAEESLTFTHSYTLFMYLDMIWNSRNVFPMEEASLHQNQFKSISSVEVCPETAHPY